MKRIAGIDHGKKRIGLAISDPMQMLASPIEIIEAKSTPRATAEAIAQVLAEHMPIEKVVIGLPLLMSGEEGQSAKEARELASHLEDVTGLPITLWDERLTTAQVERTLKEGGVSRKKRARVVDAMAARMILQSYLDSPRK